MNNCKFARQGRFAKLLDAAAMDLMFKLAAVQVGALKINPHSKENWKCCLPTAFPPENMQHATFQCSEVGTNASTFTTPINYRFYVKPKQPLRAAVGKPMAREPDVALSMAASGSQTIL